MSATLNPAPAEPPGDQASFGGDSPTRISIVVVEDHAVLADAIEISINGTDDLHVVGKATSLSDGIDLIRRRQPDVIIADVRLGDGDSTDQLDAIFSASPDSKVLIFTGWPDEASLLRAIAAGAIGFIDKATGFTEFVDALRKVARGELAVSPQLLPVLARRATSDRDVCSLTVKELDVLRLLAAGTSTRAIADDLLISLNTARNHISRLIAKLGVHSRLEAVNEGVRQGLIRYDPPQHTERQSSRDDR